MKILFIYVLIFILCCLCWILAICGGIQIVKKVFAFNDPSVVIMTEKGWITAPRQIPEKNSALWELEHKISECESKDRLLELLDCEKELRIMFKDYGQLNYGY